MQLHLSWKYIVIFISLQSKQVTIRIAFLVSDEYLNISSLLQTI